MPQKRTAPAGPRIKKSKLRANIVNNGETAKAMSKTYVDQESTQLQHDNKKYYSFM